MILQHLIVGALQVNCYIVADEATQQGAIVDAGDNATAILKLVRARGWRVTHLLNTHAHFDHVLAVAEVKAATQAPFYLHPAEVPGLRATPQMVRLWLGYEVAPPPEPEVLLHEDDRIAIGDTALRVVHVPGHSPGSVAFVDDAGRRVIAGDTLFAGSIGRTDLPGGDHDTLLNAIAAKLLTLPDDYEVLPGHGPFTTVGYERHTNPFLAAYPTDQNPR